MSAKFRQNGCLTFEQVNAIAVNNEELRPVRRGVINVISDRQIAEVFTKVVTEKLIVVARGVNDPNARPHPIQQQVHDFMVNWFPVRPNRAPDIKDITNQVDRISHVAFEEQQQGVRLAAMGPQMHVRNEK